MKNQQAEINNTNFNFGEAVAIAHITEVVGVYSELVAELALLANGYTVSRPSTAEVYDLKAEDPINGQEYKIQVKTIQVREDRGNELVVRAKRKDGSPYRKSDVDYFVGVLVTDGEAPRVYMFENREITEYWASEERASKRWVELPITLDRSIYEKVAV